MRAVDIVVFRKWLKEYSLLEDSLMKRGSKVLRFMISFITRGRIYLICQKKALTSHVLEYRIKFLSVVINLD